MGIKFWLLNSAGAAILAALAFAGYAQIPFAADDTYMTHGIAVLFMAGLVTVALRRWQTARWIADRLIFLGLLGTVVGFVIALSGVDPAKVGDVEAIGPMVGALLDGMATALFTTLIGSIGYLWLSVNAWLLAGEDI